MQIFGRGCYFSSSTLDFRLCKRTLRCCASVKMVDLSTPISATSMSRHMQNTVIDEKEYRIRFCSTTKQPECHHLVA